MRNLVVLLLLFGFFIGLIPLVWYLIGEMTTDASNVVYYGSYEPLNGITMSDDAMDRFDRSFDRQVRGTSTLWLHLVPIATASVGALTGAVLGRLGFALTRRQA